MKKIILVLTFLIIGCGPFASAENPPKVPNEFPIEEGRFEIDSIPNKITPWNDIITDKKTGCQYLTQYKGGTVSLGCSPEYISPKFKK